MLNPIIVVKLVSLWSRPLSTHALDHGRGVGMQDAQRTQVDVEETISTLTTKDNCQLQLAWTVSNTINSEMFLWYCNKSKRIWFRLICKTPSLWLAPHHLAFTIQSSHQGKLCLGGTAHVHTVVSCKPLCTKQQCWDCSSFIIEHFLLSHLHLFEGKQISVVFFQIA